MTRLHLAKSILVAFGASSMIYHGADIAGGARQLAVIMRGDDRDRRVLWSEGGNSNVNPADTLALRTERTLARHGDRTTR